MLRRVIWSVPFALLRTVPVIALSIGSVLSASGQDVFLLANPGFTSQAQLDELAAAGRNLLSHTTHDEKSAVARAMVSTWEADPATLTELAPERFRVVWEAYAYAASGRGEARWLLAWLDAHKNQMRSVNDHHWLLRHLATPPLEVAQTPATSTTLVVPKASDIAGVVERRKELARFAGRLAQRELGKTLNDDAVALTITAAPDLSGPDLAALRDAVVSAYRSQLSRTQTISLRDVRELVRLHRLVLALEATEDSTGASASAYTKLLPIYVEKIEGPAAYWRHRYAEANLLGRPLTTLASRQLLANAALGPGAGGPVNLPLAEVLGSAHVLQGTPEAWDAALQERLSAAYGNPDEYAVLLLVKGLFESRRQQKGESPQIDRVASAAVRAFETAQSPGTKELALRQMVWAALAFHQVEEARAILRDHGTIKGAPSTLVTDLEESIRVAARNIEAEQGLLQSRPHWVINQPKADDP